MLARSTERSKQGGEGWFHKQLPEVVELPKIGPFGSTNQDGALTTPSSEGNSQDVAQETTGSQVLQEMHLRMPTLERAMNERIRGKINGTRQEFKQSIAHRRLSTRLAIYSEIQSDLPNFSVASDIDCSKWKRTSKSREAAGETEGDETVGGQSLTTLTQNKLVNHSSGAPFYPTNPNRYMEGLLLMNCAWTYKTSWIAPRPRATPYETRNHLAVVAHRVANRGILVEYIGQRPK